MRNLLPPYSKYHIIVLGLPLLIGLLGLIWLHNSRVQSPGSSHTKIVSVDADSLQKDFEDPLAKVQDGQFANVWSYNNFLILDIRPVSAYDTSHIEGSLSAPITQLRYAALDPATKVVVYSSSADDIAQALPILTSKNLDNVYILHDSLDNLAKSGYKITVPRQDGAL